MGQKHLLTLTDTHGSTVHQQSFDAWGRDRKPTSWIQTPVSSAASGGFAWLNRGYTGHEHHRAFGIINMNGRLYDPVLGRMLSPDNYAHAGSQGANRYSYVLNNPLKYTDPSGENPFALFGIWPGTAAAATGVTAAPAAVAAPIWGTAQTLPMVTVSSTSLGSATLASLPAQQVAVGATSASIGTELTATSAGGEAAAAGGAASVAGGGAASVASAIPYVAVAVAIYLYIDDCANNVQQANDANNYAVQHVEVGQTGTSSYHSSAPYTPEPVSPITFDPRGASNLWIQTSNNTTFIQNSNVRYIHGDWMHHAGTTFIEMEAYIDKIPNSSLDNLIINAHGGLSYDEGEQDPIIQMQGKTELGIDNKYTYPVLSLSGLKGRYPNQDGDIRVMKKLLSKVKPDGNVLIDACDVGGCGKASQEFLTLFYKLGGGGYNMYMPTMHMRIHGENTLSANDYTTLIKGNAIMTDNRFEGTLFHYEVSADKRKLIGRDSNGNFITAKDAIITSGVSAFGNVFQQGGLLFPK